MHVLGGGEFLGKTELSLGVSLFFIFSIAFELSGAIGKGSPTCWYLEYALPVGGKGPELTWPRGGVNLAATYQSSVD